jgi:hypothetical protein
MEQGIPWASLGERRRWSTIWRLTVICGGAAGRRGPRRGITPILVVDVARGSPELTLHGGVADAEVLTGVWPEEQCWEGLTGRRGIWCPPGLHGCARGARGWPEQPGDGELVEAPGDGWSEPNGLDLEELGIEARGGRVNSRQGGVIGDMTVWHGAYRG